MLSKNSKECCDLIDVFFGLVQMTRFCRQEETFCEGVTFQQFMILDAVAKREELKMSDLHQILSVKKSTTTRLVNPLLQRGLLQREKAANDFRAVKLILTKEGLNVHKKTWLCLNNFFQRVAGNIPPDKRNDVLQSIGIFMTAVRNAAERRCCQ